MTVLRGWMAEEHVLAGPFADLLRKACAEEKEVTARNVGPFVSRGRMGQELAPLTTRSTVEYLTTSRNEYERRYAERYGVTQRTAERHFKLTLTQPTIPVVIADRVAALVGVPLAYVEATEKEA